MQIDSSTFRFLKTIRKNNNREWVHANQEWYQDSKNNFKEFTQALIGGINEFDKFGYIDAKDCMYRLHRDVRFSPNKTPYNYHFSAMIGKNGRKGSGASYYFRIKPGGLSVFAAGSDCIPEKEEMENLRMAINNKGKTFLNIINAKAFKNTFPELKGESYKRVPKPFSADNPMAELLKMKSYWVEHFVADKFICKPELFTSALSVYKQAQPFVAFINNHLHVKN